jgi:hypothetical protein
MANETNKAPETDEAKAEPAKTVDLEVRSRGAAGFRRAGRFFGPDPVEDSFDEDTARILRNEPQLFVRELSEARVERVRTEAKAKATAAVKASEPKPEADDGKKHPAPKV